MPAPSASSHTAVWWAYILYIPVVLLSLLLHLITLIFSGLLTTGIKMEWTIFFVCSTILILWMWVNQFIILCNICKASFDPGISSYLLTSYFIQSVAHVTMIIPITVFYMAVPDGQGLWIGVTCAGGVNLALTLIGGALFYFFFATKRTVGQTIRYYAVPSRQLD